MQSWTDKRPLHAIHPIISTLLQPGDLFLDIETTGLSRARHQIYLIGMASVVDNNHIYVNQLFSDNPQDEEALLTCFADALQTLEVKRIITFNGNSFDLPFLLERAALHAISLSFEAFELFDIYKEVSRRKNMLQLQNYRQKTVEQFLGICREDKYSGGELIKVYENYVRCPNAEAAHLLQLHNYEDVLGMIDLLAVFAYDEFFSSPAHVVSASVENYTDIDGNPAEELIAVLTPPCELPGCLSCTQPVSGAYLHAAGKHVRLRVPLFQGMTRLYYLDYKNYYYLPAEDMAIHKSVATCVDKAYREKATPENCYSKVAVDDAFLHSDRLAEYITHVLRGFSES
ncbi:MAG: ribonuclease H-like domain-containing protein [Lachnospiraceae bacterium]|nr:ribonuclease H-like domain-containing protein [bacterium]MDY5518326.1 ribonuclease H-like domain-containing protein [Lachnospiraceae bacterium]